MKIDLDNYPCPPMLPPFNTLKSSPLPFHHIMLQPSHHIFPSHNKSIIISPSSSILISGSPFLPQKEEESRTTFFPTIDRKQTHQKLSHWWQESSPKARENINSLNLQSNYIHPTKLLNYSIHLSFS